MNILLIKRAKKHDKAAFQKLMEQQGPALYKAAKAILKNDEDVADAMQETDVKSPHYQFDKETLRMSLLAIVEKVTG